MLGDTISGTPTAEGNTTVTVTVTNAGGTVNKAFDFSILAPPVITSPTYAPTTRLLGVVGQSLSYQITGTGTPVITYTAAPLPAGLTFSGATATISGIPTTQGVVDVIMTATNATGPAYRDTKTLYVQIDPVQITSPSTAAGALSTAFTYTITATGSPTIFTATNLPPGLTRTGAIISGIPTQAGAFRMTITASNGVGSATADVVVGISTAPGAPAITSSLLLPGVMNTPLTYTIVATNNPTSYSALNLPPGLSINNAVITGTPTTQGTWEVPISATNALGTGSGTLTIAIAQANNAPAITSSLKQTAFIGVAFSYTITSIGSTPLTFSAVGLPGNLVVNAATGVIAPPAPPGTVAAVAGTYNITISAANGLGTGSATLVLTISDGTPTITSQLVYSIPVGTAFAYTITASGQTPITFSATSLPSWLTNSGASVFGTPTTAGIYTCTLNASNVFGVATPQTLTIIVNNSSPHITNSPLSASGTVGTPFSWTITAFGTQPITYTAVPLPPGLTLAGNVISGTPTQDGSYAVALTATNSINPPDSKTLVITISPQPPGFVTPMTAKGMVGQAFSYTIPVTGSTSVVTATGLPDGLTLAGNLITGTPFTGGDYTVNLTATNGGGVATGQLAISIQLQNNDSDNDGFPDELEIALGSDPNDKNSTPLGGGQVLSLVDVFNITSMSIKLNFAAVDKDAIKIKGTVAAPPGTALTGAKVTLFVGGVVRNYTLDDKGAAAVGSDKVRIKTNKSLVTTCQFSLKGLFQKELADEGLVGTADVKGLACPMNVYLIIGDMLFTAERQVIYSARTGKNGSAKLVK
jgi:hypothetical protein